MEAVKKIILDNQRTIIREFADDIGILFGSCQLILTDVISIKGAQSKIVPKL